MLHWKFGASIEVILHLPFHSVTTIMKHRIETLQSDLKGLISAEATLEQDWGGSLENRHAHCTIGHISIGVRIIVHHRIAFACLAIWCTAASIIGALRHLVILSACDLLRWHPNAHTVLIFCLSPPLPERDNIRSLYMAGIGSTSSTGICVCSVHFLYDVLLSATADTSSSFSSFKNDTNFRWCH